MQKSIILRPLIANAYAMVPDGMSKLKNVNVEKIQLHKQYMVYMSMKMVHVTVCHSVPVKTIQNIWFRMFLLVRSVNV